MAGATGPLPVQFRRAAQRQARRRRDHLGGRDRGLPVLGGQCFLRESSRPVGFYAILRVQACVPRARSGSQNNCLRGRSSVKRLISSQLAVGLIAACGALAAVPAGAEPKIGVVDPQRLLEESPQGKAMLDAMRTEFAPRERTLQAQQQALKAKQDKLQKDGATMTDEQRTRAEKELRDGARDFERARSEFQDDISARRNEEMSRLQKTLGEEVRSYAKAQSFDVVLSTEGVVYAAPAYDVTPAILTALQARNAASPATAAPAARPAPPAKPQTH
ncbi:MAG: OmpH family outer membrane protein [Gammaproteobacteria bacterium]|nr:MAG: OmpH family outer membrane protein [Gammaproteobacteria bacterium]